MLTFVFFADCLGGRKLKITNNCGSVLAQAFPTYVT